MQPPKFFGAGRRLPGTADDLPVNPAVPVKSPMVLDEKTLWINPGSPLPAPKNFGGSPPIELPCYKAAPLPRGRIVGCAREKIGLLGRSNTLQKSTFQGR
jgi:hypothetical protein